MRDGGNEGVSSSNLGVGFERRGNVKFGVMERRIVFFRSPADAVVSKSVARKPESKSIKVEGDDGKFVYAIWSRPVGNNGTKSHVRRRSFRALFVGGGRREEPEPRSVVSAIVWVGGVSQVAQLSGQVGE